MVKPKVSTVAGSKDVSPLRAGQNILAIHALDNSSDKFFLLSVTLFESDRAVFGEDVAPGAQEYTDAIALARSTTIKARAWRLGTWSALTEAVCTVGPMAQSLRAGDSPGAIERRE